MYNKQTSELAVCSLNAVRALARLHPETITRLFLRVDCMKEFGTLCKSLAERRAPYKICDDTELEKICKTPHHQGIAAMIQEPYAEALTQEDLDLWVNERKTGIVLHEVGNAMNLGAVVRAAAFFDTAFVVVSGVDTEARLTTAAYRAAEGGMEYVTLRSVRRTKDFLRDAGKKLLVIGADHRARRRLSEIGDLVNKSARGVVLVLGNEEHGLPDNIKTECHALLRIPGTGIIESLNLSHSAALFLHGIYEL